MIYIINVCKGLLEPGLKDAFVEEKIVDAMMSWISYPYQDCFYEEKLQKWQMGPFLFSTVTGGKTLL